MRAEATDLLEESGRVRGVRVTTVRFIPVDLGEPSGSRTLAIPLRFTQAPIVAHQPSSLAKPRPAGDPNDGRNRTDDLEDHVHVSRREGSPNLRVLRGGANVADQIQQRLSARAIGAQIPR